VRDELDEEPDLFSADDVIGVLFELCRETSNKDLLDEPEVAISYGLREALVQFRVHRKEGGFLVETEAGPSFLITAKPVNNP